MSFDSTTNKVSELKLDDGLKVINNVDKNETDNYLSEVPVCVQRFAEEKLKSFNFDLPLLELVYVLSGMQ